MLHEPFGKNVLWYSILACDVPGEITHLLTIAETPDGKKHLAGISRLPAGVVVQTNAERIERLLSETSLL